jgi:hypothetical protein
LAKVSPHILSPERFAIHLGVFLVSKYSHIDKADVKVEQLKWKRILVPGEQKDEDEHSHAFWRDGEDKRVAKVIVRFVFLVFSFFLFLFLLFRWGGIFAFGGLLWDVRGNVADWLTWFFVRSMRAREKIN